MNEIINYDPANYHTSMTRSVFIKLDGSMIRISNTNARIPKRAMWNEPIINRKNITFTRHRCYDLFGCRIEMCPRGLARKRYNFLIENLIGSSWRKLRQGGSGSTKT